jgi:hypothetical protein
VRTASVVLAGSLLFSVSLALVSACSSSEATLPTNGSTKDGGSSGSSGTSGAAVDARNPYPSFKDDVAPIIQQSCALTACHGSRQSNLGIFLGYDPAMLYTELQKTSPTAMIPFVVAGDPSKSYLILKLQGMQATESASCPSMSCGTVMPPDDPLPAAKIKVFTDWVMAGAKND